VSDRSDLNEYLNKSLKYELLMLRYTLPKIKAPPCQMELNAYFESFVVHARNLYQFLTNEGRGNDAGAREFASHFKANKTNDTISLFAKILPQILHLGRNRPSDPSKQANVDGAQKWSDWIEKNFKAFIDALGPEYAWDWNDADPFGTHIAINRSVGGITQPERLTTTSLPGTEYTFVVKSETDASNR
jgi:hypothetical protein